MLIRNQRLHDALKAFLVEFLDLTGDRVKRGQLAIPEQLVARVEFLGGGFKHDVEAVQDYVGLASKVLLDFGPDLRLDPLLATLMTIPEVRAFLMIGSGGSEPAVMNLRISLLARLIDRYYRECSLQARSDFRFDEGAFLTVYESLEEYLLGNEDTHRLIAPLVNFDMTEERLALGLVTIRLLDADEVVRFNHVLPDSRSITERPSFGLARFGVETVVKSPRGSSEGISAGLDRLWWSVVCLKLAKKGAVTYGDVWMLPFHWSPYPGVTHQSRVVQSSFFDVYRLTRDDMPYILRIWSKIERYIEGPPPFWMVALGRFDDSTLRPRAEDKLIDTWIGCEALLGKGVEVGELRYQLSLRLAHLLETDAAARKKVRDSAMEAYKWRGKVVHGVPKLDHRKLSDLSLEMESLLREALRKCLLNEIDTQEKLVTRIEASIIGETPLKEE